MSTPTDQQKAFLRSLATERLAAVLAPVEKSIRETVSSGVAIDTIIRHIRKNFPALKTVSEDELTSYIARPQTNLPAPRP